MTPPGICLCNGRLWYSGCPVHGAKIKFLCGNLMFHLTNRSKLDNDIIKEAHEHLHECETCRAEVACAQDFPFGCTDENIGKKVAVSLAAIVKGKSNTSGLEAHVKGCAGCTIEVEEARKALTEAGPGLAKRLWKKIGGKLRMKKSSRIVQMETSLGKAEATKAKQSDPWTINYPWGGDTFYGTVPEVKARMRKNIAENDEKEEG